MPIRFCLKIGPPCVSKLVINRCISLCNGSCMDIPTFLTHLTHPNVLMFDIYYNYIYIYMYACTYIPIIYRLHIGISHKHPPVNDGTLMAGAPLDLRILLGGPPEVSVLSMRSRGRTAAGAHQVGLSDSVWRIHMCTHIHK